MELYLSSGANIDIQNRDGITPLIQAAMSGKHLTMADVKEKNVSVEELYKEDRAEKPIKKSVSKKLKPKI